MRQSLPALVALLSLFGCALPAYGEQRERAVPVSLRASAGTAAIVGTVRDQAGAGLADVSVLAVGTTMAMVKSDRAGRFAIVLPAGEYVLRATRDGYVSTFREAVRVQSDAAIHRTITLLKADESAPFAQPVAVGAPRPVSEPAEAAAPGPEETVWRLRHLPRTVLREGSVRWAPEEEAKPLAASLRAMPDFSGHVDLLTTGSLAVASGEPLAAGWPRGVAYVVVGAPVGSHGDWTVRTALSPGDSASWTFSSEYRTRADNRHAFRTGVSYGAQTLQSELDRGISLTSPADVRRVGGAYGYDRWRVGPGMEITYGGRVDRYDYLGRPTLIGGTAGGRAEVAPHAELYAEVSKEHVAPGAQEFQPPSMTGAWLPPDRTFSALDGRRPLEAAEVDRHTIGMAFGFGRRTASGSRRELEVHAGRFVEITNGQIATIFGLDSTSAIGHYYVGSAGATRVEGVGVGFAGRIAPSLTARIDYAFTRTDWQRLPGSTLARVARNRDNRSGHDLTSSVDGILPVSGAKVRIVLRVNDAFSLQRASQPGLGARFAIDLQQPLPVHFVGQEQVVLVIAARTLLKDLEAGGGYLDDLVTVAPPLRVTCGIQMRF